MLTKTLEGRVLKVDSLSDEARTADIRLVGYNVVDSDGQMFSPGSLDQALKADYIPLLFDHDWGRPIGHMVEFLGDDSLGPVARFAFDDFESVPLAKAVFSQLKSGTLRHSSVGFSHRTKIRPATPDEAEKYVGLHEVIEDVDLYELSVVLRGAVPFAAVVSTSKKESGLGEPVLDQGLLESNVSNTLLQVGL